MGKLTKKLQEATSAAMMDTVDGVAVPNRGRTFSFTTMLGNMEVGDGPVAKVARMHDEDFLDFGRAVTEHKLKLRNNTASSISAAKRRLPNSQFSIECGTLTMESGVYVVALVHRTE